MCSLMLYLFSFEQLDSLLYQPREAEIKDKTQNGIFSALGKDPQHPSEVVKEGWHGVRETALETHAFKYGVLQYYDTLGVF